MTKRQIESGSPTIDFSRDYIRNTNHSYQKSFHGSFHLWVSSADQKPCVEPRRLRPTLDNKF